MGTARGEAKAIKTRSTENHDSAGNILSVVPSLRDRVPWWVTVMQNLTLLGLLAGVVGTAVYFGVGPLVRSAIGKAAKWIPALIPEPTKQEAREDADSLESGAADRRRIDMQRKADPTYRAALDRELKRKEKQR